jgi:hypothetical protein
MKLLIPIFLFVVLSGLVFASDFDTSYSPLTKNVYPGMEAEFEVTITNNANKVINLVVVPNEFSSNPFSEVFEYVRVNPEKLSFGGQETKKVRVKAKILEDAVPNKIYMFSVKFRDAKNQELLAEQDVKAEVSLPEELVIFETNFPEEVIAKTNFKFDLKATDKYNVDLSDVKIEIREAKGNILEKDINTGLSYETPYEEEVILDVNPNAQPGSYVLEIKAVVNGKVRGYSSKKFNVIRNPDVKEKTVRDSRFLIEKVRFIKSNEGNTEQEESFYYNANWFSKIFITYGTEPTEKQSNALVWAFTLEPGKTYEVDVQTDYRGLCLIILILILLAILGVYFFGKKIVIRKEVFKVKHEGGLSELKIMLHVKNRGRELRDIEIIDFLPKLIHPVKGNYSTLEPFKVQSGSLGLKLIWRLDRLRFGEERIITYRVGSSLNIIGSITLPRTVVKYHFGKRIIQVRSKKASSP